MADTWGSGKWSLQSLTTLVFLSVQYEKLKLPVTGHCGLMSDHTLDVDGNLSETKTKW